MWLKSLSPREAEIVNAYFGLDGENGVTIEQIGQKYDLTKRTYPPDQGRSDQAFTKGALQQCIKSIFRLKAPKALSS